MRAVTGGRGPVLLLLHGYPQSLCAWHSVAPQLARDHLVVAVDLPGYGGSHLTKTSAVVTRPSRRSIAAALLETMDLLGHDNFVVVGHDRGARAGFRMALDSPGRVAGLASLTVVPTLDVWDAIDGRFALRAPHWFFFAQSNEVLESLLSHDPDVYLDSVLATMAGDINRVHPLALADYRSAFRRRPVREAIYQDYRSALTVDLDHERADRACGAKLACPVLFLWDAGNAPADPLAVWKRWADDVDGAGLPGGHLLPENAAGAVSAQLATFVARCTGAAAKSHSGDRR